MAKEICLLTCSCVSNHCQAVKNICCSECV